MCLSLIRSHIDYGDLVWFPVLKKHIETVENIQRQSTKLLPELRNMSYKDWLKNLNLPTLLYQWKHADMIQVFKIIKGMIDIHFEEFFQLAELSTGGHTCNLKLFKPRCCKSVRLSSFASRVIENWSSLSEEVILLRQYFSLKLNWINFGLITDLRILIHVYTVY